MRNRIIISLVLTVVITFAAFAEFQQAPVKKFSVGSGSRIVLNAGSGDINIQLVGAGEVTVEALGVDAADLEIEQQGDTLNIHSAGGRWEEVEFNIAAPSNIELDLKTGGGDITIEGTLNGRLAANTAGGDIEFEDINGDLQIKSSGGDIEGGDITGDASVKTMGGDFKVGSIQGVLEMNSMGGDIKIDNVASSLNVKTLGGDVEVGDVGGTAEVASKGGDVIIGRVTAGATLKTAGGDVRLGGADGDIVVKTAGGDIELEGIVGSIEAATAGGDIHVELSPAGGRSSIDTKGGDITLVIPGGAGATVVAIIEIAGGWESDDKEYQIMADLGVAPTIQTRDGNVYREIYEVNGGGPEITLKTVNGDIRITQGRVLE